MASKAVRDRKNRRDTSQEMNEAFLGAMVTARAYNGNVRMVSVNNVIPSTAAFAGRMADGLLPEVDE